MKGMLAGMVAVGLALGLLAVTSAIYAGDGKQIETAELQTQDELDVAAWEAWRTDLAGAIAADEEFTAATAAVEAYQGEDEHERARLESVRDEIYYEIARPVYEDHFGPWEGTDDDFVVFLRSDDAQEQRKNYAECTTQAIRACGQGKVKSVTVTDGGGCSFECVVATPIP